RRLSVKYSKLWVGAEILLFVLVGATVDISYAFKAGIGAVILIFGVLLFRMVGVFFCLIKTNLTIKERLFCMIGYIPKATVQAAIGGVPLAMGIASGQLILTLAVLAILITAPLGAFGIDVTYKKLLTSVEGKSK
ncbi:sodium:proton antiporter, partial [Clostridioides difficile]|nr:sodium:proton antiporter [Clostridioides difficile]